MKFEAGKTAQFEASFYSEGITPAVLDQAPTVEFYEPDDTPALVGSVAVITQLSPATWRAEVIIPENTPADWYKIVWNGVVGGNDVFGVENFEIVDFGDVLITSPEKLLRRKLNDKLDDDSDDSDAFFTDDEIHSFLAAVNGNISYAAFEGWGIKMAWYSDSIDINESGSDRKGSQLFRQAKSMADFYRQKIKDDAEAAQAGMAQPVAIVASLRRGRADVFGFRYSPFALDTTQPHVRLFLTKRFADSYYLACQEGWMTP